jgi:multidrug efflux pump subunit AcrA (membrane-fusion protein)
MALQKTFNKKHGRIILGVFLMVAIIGSAGFYGYKTSLAAQPTVPPAPPTVAASKGEVTLSVTAPGVSVNTRTVSVDAEFAASVQEILVHPGDAVKAGQVLAHLGDRDRFETAVTDAQIALLQAQKTLDGINDSLALSQAALALAQAQKDYDTAKTHLASKEYQRGDQNSIDVAQAALIVANAGLRDAEDIFNRNKDRSDTDPQYAAALTQLAAARQRQAVAQGNLDWLKSLPNPNDVAQAQATLNIAKATLDNAQKKYDQLSSGSNPDRTLAEQQVKSAQAGLDQANTNLKNLDATAPFDGVITSVPVSVGQNVGIGTSLMTLIDPQALDVEATVVEEDFPLIQVGQAVQLYFDALAESDVTGKVARIIPERVTGSAQANYTIVVTLDHPVDHLAAGMTVDGSIVISQKENVLRLPRSVVHAQPDSSAIIEVWAGGQKQRRTIHVGLRGDSFTEVTDGLQEGEQVVAQ